MRIIAVMDDTLQEALDHLCAVTEELAELASRADLPPDSAAIKALSTVARIRQLLRGGMMATLDHVRFGFDPSWEEKCERAKKTKGWVIACGGTETPYLNANRQRVLYVYQPATGRHGWLGPDDIVYADELLSEEV